MSHYKKVCRLCEDVIEQCRCMDCNKIIIKGICKDCEKVSHIKENEEAIFRVLIDFPNGTNSDIIQKIVMYAEKVSNYGLSSGGYLAQDHYQGMADGDFNFSDDTMHFTLEYKREKRENKHNIEEISKKVHQAYCDNYLKRKGEPYWTKGDYSLLDEETKEIDRATVRAVIDNLKV